MDAAQPQAQAKVLRKSEGPEDYALYRAALEWGLLDPIVIDKREDLKSEVRWRNRVEPYHHQVTNLVTFCGRLPVTLLADDVGLGKTISAGLIASELISRRRVAKVLIVAPKLLGPQWREELKEKFNIPAVIATGRDLLECDPEGDFGAVITTYHSARLYVQSLPADRFQMLILDEAHKLRNLYGVTPTPQVATRFREVLAARSFKFVLMLTATPIQNRLWDLYSLVDLLTVARGHENPFGSEGMFARRFIADDRGQARQLKPEARDLFRSIVYGYMSRVRRADANLHFPDRNVLLRSVAPTAEELQLIAVLAKPLQKLNRLSQISILQALTSSPDALNAQLANMVRNGTFPGDVAHDVNKIVKAMPTSAKLKGLAALVEQLRKENPQSWRMVVFTQRRETQTTIQAYLESRGISVGIINGDSGERNQETIGRFKKSPPQCHVIVSTEAGSEGVNLQAANVLVNYDLPWNPMIVEQRIGRIQRLASEHANVFVYSVILRGTFEEYIVGRLMEKLQMASHAIGDIEALLEASGLGGEEDENAESFGEEIRRLVMDSLAGKNVEVAMRKAEASIANAKIRLAEEERNIDEILGTTGDADIRGPRGPKLPPLTRSMLAADFVRAALTSLGARLIPRSPDVFSCEYEGRTETIRLTDGDAIDNTRVVAYTPGSPAFDRLVAKCTQSGVHDVDDVDQEPEKKARAIVAEWIAAFGGSVVSVTTEKVSRCFDGSAYLQMRATVAHDSYERLVTVPLSPDEHQVGSGVAGLSPLATVIDKPQTLGVDIARVAAAGAGDPGIAEFCRFYIERRQDEALAAGTDQRKRKKLEDDFTPRLEATLVGLQGNVSRDLTQRVTYAIDGAPDYTSRLTIRPSAAKIVQAPVMARCTVTGRIVPRDALATCDVTKDMAMKHLLVRSEFSDRYALPKHTAYCSLSGKRGLTNELELSVVSNQPVARTLLKTSSVSGRKAEPQYFGSCQFTHAEALLSELRTSEISGKSYRADQSAQSVLSGRAGHTSEFIACAISGRTLLPGEADRCDVTGAMVLPGNLQNCAVSQRRVLPSELERSSISGASALRQYFVLSSISRASMFETEAIRSADGRHCSPREAVRCSWSDDLFHPDDVRECELASLPIHYSFATRQPPTRLLPLRDMLFGHRKAADLPESWDAIAALASGAFRGKIRVEAAQQSPGGNHLAVCAELRTLFGLRTHHVGFVYSLVENAIVGSTSRGKRGRSGWVSIDE